MLSLSDALFLGFIWDRIQPVEETGFVIKVRERNIHPFLFASRYPLDATSRYVERKRRTDSVSLFLFFVQHVHLTDQSKMLSGFLFSRSLSLALVSLLLYIYVAIPPFPLPPIHSRFIVNSNTFLRPSPRYPFRVYPSLHLFSLFSSPSIFLSVTITTISDPIFLFLKK